jgi:hypothetical protein
MKPDGNCTTFAKEAKIMALDAITDIFGTLLRNKNIDLSV